MREDYTTISVVRSMGPDGKLEYSIRGERGEDDPLMEKARQILAQAIKDESNDAIIEKRLAEQLESLALQCEIEEGDFGQATPGKSMQTLLQEKKELLDWMEHNVEKQKGS